MNIKTYIQSKLHKTHIPHTKDLIMMRIKDIEIVMKPKKRMWIDPFLALKTISSFMIIIGMTLVLLPSFDSDVEAFTSYDEVMVLSSTSVYALYEAYITPVEDDISMAHVMTLRTQLRTMIKYAYTFERLIQTEGNFNIKKNLSETRYELDFFAIDAFNDRLPFQMRVEKAFKNNQRDQFDFSGQFESFDIQGDVSYEKDRHMVNVSYVKDAFQVKVTYDDLLSTYQMDLYEGNTIIQTFTFFIDYDAFERATLNLSYAKDNIDTNLIISQSIISQEMTIEYEIENQNDIYKGLITVNVTGGILPKYIIEILFEDGETMRFQFIRPKTIRKNIQPITNNLIDRNVL